jgi:hypothetical protein
MYRHCRSNQFLYQIYREIFCWFIPVHESLLWACRWQQYGGHMQRKLWSVSSLVKLWWKPIRRTMCNMAGSVVSVGFFRQFLGLIRITRYRVELTSVAKFTLQRFPNYCFSLARRLNVTALHCSGPKISSHWKVRTKALAEGCPTTPYCDWILYEG